MHTETPRPMKEQLLSSMNAKETHTKASELISREQIKNTPFDLAGNEEHGYFIGAGKYRFTEPRPTKEEALNDLDELQWLIIANMIAAFSESMLNSKIYQLNNPNTFSI